MDICQITPDAPQCTAAKEINLGEEAKKKVRAEVYAVQQQYVIKAQRFEIMPYFETTLNDQFVQHNAPGLALNYYITQVLAVGVNGNWYGGLNAPSDFNFQNRRAALISAPLTEYQYSGDLNFTYVPMYGKFAGFGDFIFHYDAYVDGGVTIQQFLRAGLIQRLTITRVPVLIGQGIPLFGVLPHDIRLRHIATQHYPSGLVQTEYEIMNE